MMFYYFSYKHTGVMFSGLNLIVYIQEGPNLIPYSFRSSETIGYPDGAMSTSQKGRLERLASDMTPTTSNNPAYFRKYNQSGGYTLIPNAANGRAISYTTAKGREISLNAPELGIELIYDSNNAIRQAFAMTDGLADVVVTETGKSYEIRFYTTDQVGAKNSSTGYYTFTGNPYKTFRFEDVSSSGNGSDVNVIKTFPGGTQHTDNFTYINNDWVLTECVGDPEEKRIEKTKSVSGTNVTEIKKVYGSGNTLVYQTKEVKKRTNIGDLLLKSYEGPDQYGLETTYEYYETQNATQVGIYGKMKSVKYPNGNWERFEYDSAGRKTKHVKAWKDNTFATADNLNRVITYTYVTNDASDQRPRTIHTQIAGVTTEKIFREYETDSATGEELQTREIAGTASAQYGEPGNQRTVARFYAPDIPKHGGRLKSITNPDGTLETYTYEFGSFTPGVALGGYSFTVDNLDGAAIRKTVTYGTVDDPAGIANKTVQNVTITNAFADDVVSEQYVYTGSAYEKIAWKENRFDSEHKILESLDNAGRYVEQTWNCCNLTSRTDWDGTEYTYEYDGLNRLVAANKLGVTSGDEPVRTEYAYDANGKQLSVTVSAGTLSLSTSSAYDLAGRITGSTAENGLSTAYSYTLPTANSGFIDTVTYPGGATQLTEYYSNAYVKSVTGTAAVPVYYDYGIDANGLYWNKTSIGSSGSPRWQTSYWNVLQQKIKVESAGYDNSTLTVNYTYDSRGNVVKVEQPESADTIYVYDDLNNPIRTGLDVDAGGTLDLASNDRISDSEAIYLKIDNDWWLQSTQKVYGTSNDDTATTVSVSKKRITGFPSNTVAESVAVDVYGNETASITTMDRANKTISQTIIYPDSTVSEQTVKVNGLTVSQRTKTNLTYTMEYDGLGRRISQTDPRTGTSTVEYYTSGTGKIGQVYKQTDAADNATEYDYDSATGRTISVKNPLNKYTYIAYDARGRQTRIWGDADYPVELVYDTYGQTTAMKTYRAGTGWDSSTWPGENAVADITTWVYDNASGLVKTKTDANGKSTTYAYTPAGNLSVRTWAREYDNAALTTTYAYSSATKELASVTYADSTQNLSYTYNRLGQPLTVTDAAGTRTFSYDSSFDLTSEEMDGIYNKTTEYSYATTGVKGRAVAFGIDDGDIASYSYDAYGRLNGINDIEYNFVANSSLLGGIVRPNDVNTTFTYETNRNLVTEVENSINNTILSNYGYTNDAIGRRTAMARSGSVFTASDTLSYSYNDRSEVTGASSNEDENYSYLYSFDNIGNRVSASLGGTSHSYTVNNLNQYTVINSTNPTYDDDGNMLSYDGWALTWNAENRLIKMEKDLKKLEFDYDYMGRRIFKKVYDGITLVSHTRFVYQGYKLIEELDALNNNAILKQYVWQPVGLDTVATTYDASDDETYYYHSDANKNITEITNNNGNVVAHYEYSPFGMLVNSTGSYADTNPFRFSSEYFDSETGLIYYNFRYYSPELGRWTSRDPIEEYDGGNLYAMLKNNVINTFDITGLLADDCKAPKKWKVKATGAIIPPADGCSLPKKTAKKFGIADVDNPRGAKCSFKPCCDEHDMCYSNCNMSKSECDKKFSKCLTQVCEDCDDEKPKSCHLMQGTYATGVQNTIADGAYKNRQEKNCECCL